MAQKLPEPLQTFDAVIWLNLQELIDQPDLDPLLQLLTLPVRPESDLRRSSRQILYRRPHH